MAAGLSVQQEAETAGYRSLPSPKAQRTGGRGYEPVDLPEGELKKKLVALYCKECERQKTLFEKFQAGGS